MPDWRIIEDVFVPEYIKTLTLTVANPGRLFKELPDMLIDIFRRTSPDLYEDIIKWDVSGDPVDFYGSWRIRDIKDARTTMWGIITIQGKQAAKDRSGSVTFWLRGNLMTKIPYTTPIDKSIAWLYSKMFYAERRRRYLVEAREGFDKLENAIRATFGLVPRVKVERAV